MSNDRFIPFLKKDIVQMCAERLKQRDNSNEFATFCTLLINRIHYEYHQKLESLKDHYAPFDPDKVTRNLASVSPEDRASSQRAFVKYFAQLLNSASFKQITDTNLRRTLWGNAKSYRPWWLVNGTRCLWCLNTSTAQFNRGRAVHHVYFLLIGFYVSERMKMSVVYFEHWHLSRM